MPRGNSIYRYTCPNPACGRAMARWDSFQRHMDTCRNVPDVGVGEQHAERDTSTDGAQESAQYWDWGPSANHSAIVETPDAASWPGIGGGPAFEEEVRTMMAFLEDTCQPIVSAVSITTAIDHEPVREYWERRMRMMSGAITDFYMWFKTFSVAVVLKYGLKRVFKPSWVIQRRRRTRGTHVKQSTASASSVS